MALEIDYLKTTYDLYEVIPMDNAKALKALEINTLIAIGQRLDDLNENMKRIASCVSDDGFLRIITG